MSDRNIQVRECAYYLWEAEGRPQGRSEMHWQMAEIAITIFSYLQAAKTAAERSESVATNKI